MKLLCIDGNSILNRAFYGIKLLSTREGQFTNGIYGFLSIYLKIVEEVAPDRVAIAFDRPEPTFRHQRYAGYKASRKGMPPELAAQLPVLKELLGYLGLAVVELPGYEADDILGTLSRAAREAGGSCVIATGDRDAFQLVDDAVQVRMASTRMGQPEAVLYDRAAIREKYGVEPTALIQVKALMGDASDEIPGVAGVGEKTALALIGRFGTLEDLYEHLDDPAVKPAVREKLIRDRAQAFMSRELAEICRSAPLDTDMESYRPRPAEAAAASLLGRLEMVKMIDRFGLDPAAAEAAAPAGEAAPPLPCVALASLAGDAPLYLAWAPDEKGCLCFAASDGAAAAFGDEAADAAWLSAALAGRTLLVPDAKALFGWAAARGIDIDPDRVAFDATLAGYLLNPAGSGYGLEALAAEYGGARPTFADASAPAEALGRLMAVTPVLQQKIDQSGQQALLAEMEIPLARVLARMEQVGFGVSRQELVAFGESLTGEIAQLQQQIWEMAGGEFNIASPKQLGEVLFVRLGLPAGRKTKSGYSTDAEVLEHLRAQHPIVGDILRYRQLTKLKSTYVDGFVGLIGPDGRIHSRFLQTETRTGRISSAEPNMQNIPVRTELGSRMRRFFRAKEGYLLADADYSQIELRVLAHMAGDQNMIRAFAEGEDIHTTTAAQVFGVPESEVTPALRSRAKAVNFGIVYGIGAFSLAGDIGVPVAEADRYIKNYLAHYAGVRQFMEESVRLGREQGYVQTLFHRRRYLPELASSNHNLRAFGERVAMNTPIQGTAADIIKLAMVRVDARLAAEKLDARLILQVHDELIVEVSRADAETVRRLLTEEMEAAVRLSVPMQAACKLGESWYDAK